MNRTLLLSALVASLTVCAFAQPPNQRPKVVVISLDGFPAGALDDPRLPIPTLRTLMRNGAAGSMTVVNPSVTWPNHTAMVTGVRPSEHGVLVNGTLTRTGSWPPVKVEPMLPKTEMVRVPTVYDAAHAAGLTTAQVDWVAINKAPTITWAFSEWATADGPVEKDMIERGLLGASDLEAFSKSNILFRDQIWTKAAVYLIKYRQPDLLLYHLLSLDSTHHQYGPGSLASKDSMAFLDSCVEKVVAAVREAGLAERTTFIVVSDHGFKKYTKEIRAASALDQAGLNGKAWVLPEGGTAFVYLAEAEVAALLPRVRTALAGIEGIDRIVESSEFPALGLPAPEKDRQMGHLLLTAKTGYSFSGGTGGPVTAAVPQVAGSHGYVASDPEMNAIFIAAGRGVKPGLKLDRVANTDVAATIAKFLGIALPSSTGRPVPLD